MIKSRRIAAFVVAVVATGAILFANYRVGLVGIGCAHSTDATGCTESVFVNSLGPPALAIAAVVAASAPRLRGWVVAVGVATCLLVSAGTFVLLMTLRPWEV